MDYVDICLLRDDNDEPFLAIAPAWKLDDGDIVGAEDKDGNNRRGKVHSHYTTQIGTDVYQFIASVFGENPEKYRVVEYYRTVGLEWPD